MKRLCLLVLSVALLTSIPLDLVMPVAHAQTSPRIADVEVRGNRRVESEAIRRQMTTEVGSILDPVDIGADIRRIYDLGFFDDIVVSLKDTAAGPTLIVEVKEKPIIRSIILEGNAKIKDLDLEEKFTVKKGQILNRAASDPQSVPSKLSTRKRGSTSQRWTRSFGLLAKKRSMSSTPFVSTKRCRSER